MPKQENYWCTALGIEKYRLKLVPYVKDCQAWQNGGKQNGGICFQKWGETCLQTVKKRESLHQERNRNLVVGVLLLRGVGRW